MRKINKSNFEDYLYWHEITKLKSIGDIIVNAHNLLYAQTIDWDDIETIRATPTEVRYISGGIFEFTCTSLNRGRINLQADEERAVKNLYDLKDTYGTGLASDWITDVQNRGTIQINSTRGAVNPLNWYVYDDFIAFFTTNKFMYIDIETIQHACPNTWQFNRALDIEGLFGGILEISHTPNMIIRVECGFNNGNSGLKMYINNTKFRNYKHTRESFDKLITDLNEQMR